MKTRVLVLAALWLAAAVSVPVAGRGADEAGWAYDLADELMSPYCPGRTLAECPSQQAQTLRMWLITQEAAGRSEDEVMAELLERFGDEILAAPRPEGFGLAAYVIPVLLFLLGGLIVGVTIKRQTRVAPVGNDAGAAEGPLDPDLERLVEEDLAR